MMNCWLLQHYSGPLNRRKLEIPGRKQRRMRAPRQAKVAQSNIKGFSDLEVAFLTEEIVDESCYLRPGLIELASGDTVVDIGANVGVFSQHAAEIVGSRGFVLSVEALPPTYSLLQENRVTLQRQAASPCTWIADNAAVGDADGGTRSMTFFPRAAGWGTGMPKQHAALMQQDLKQFIRNLLEDNTSLVARSLLARIGLVLRRLLPWLFEAVLNLYVRWMASGARQYVVPSRTVSSLLKEHQLAAVQLLKVDVEGAEVEVLQGLDAHAWQTVQQVVVEAHSDTLVDTVATMLRQHYGTVDVEQSARTRGTQLHMVYATEPLHIAGRPAT